MNKKINSMMIGCLLMASCILLAAVPPAFAEDVAKDQILNSTADSITLLDSAGRTRVAHSLARSRPIAGGDPGAQGTGRRYPGALQAWKRCLFWGGRFRRSGNLQSVGVEAK